MVNDSDIFDDSSAAEEKAVENLYADVFAFVDDFLIHVYARELRSNQSFRWCAKWHHHPESVARLEALWIAFESLRQHPTTGRSTWWLQHADPTMLALTEPDGPFRQCDPNKHNLPRSLPSASRFVDLEAQVDATVDEDPERLSERGL